MAEPLSEPLLPTRQPERQPEAAPLLEGAAPGQRTAPVIRWASVLEGNSP